MRDDAELQPWFDHAKGLVPGVEIFDAHMHVGVNDPDGFKATPPQILHALELAGASAFVDALPVTSIGKIDKLDLSEMVSK